MSQATFKQYYRLTKPGIIYGNSLTTVAGYLFAAGRAVDLATLLAVVIGTAAVIAAACTINNYTDRAIDKKMVRTKKRALASGTISAPNALIFAALLGCLGFSLLTLYTNWLTVLVGVVGIVDYTILYAYAKRRTAYGTLVGSICGAAPILAGYTAGAGRLDLAGMLLFIIMVFWQMPHFFAIATYRSSDYQAAGIPVLPLASGMVATKRQIVGFTVAFVVACLLLTITNNSSWTFGLIMAVVGLRWLWLGSRGFRTSDDNKWAKQMFGFSLLTLLIMTATLSVDTFLP